MAKAVIKTVSQKYGVNNVKKILFITNRPNLVHYQSSLLLHGFKKLLGSNNVYDIPRELIKSLGVELVEMKRSKRKSFCCGAGGAQMFKEPENGAQDININRTEEALALKPDIIEIQSLNSKKTQIVNL